MTNIQQAEEVNGKTMQWTWTDGPTRGETHEHVFHKDGTVEWHAVEETKKNGATKEKPERPKYAAMKVADGIYAVSYLAASGYTLTTVLNFHDHKLFGFASDNKTWSPVQGKFEVVN